MEKSLPVKRLRRSSLFFLLGGSVALSVASSGISFAGAHWRRCGTAGSSRVQMAIAKSTAQEPWKPLVFKMPGKRQERQPDPEDDGYSTKMREQLKGLKLKDDKGPGEARSVSETKVDDLISKEAEDAKINGLNAMWYMDRIREQNKKDRDNPDQEVLRKKYQGALEKLEGKPLAHSNEAAPEGPKSGFVELTNSLDIDHLIAKAGPSALLPKQKHHDVSAATSQPEEEAEDEGIAEFLEGIQKRLMKEDSLSRRVMKSPEDRKKDYEETKLRMYAITVAFGMIGSGVSSILYDVSTAFSFGLGSLGALSYLTGLSAYTDNAESPMGQALGGRRLLSPVLVVLIVTGWDRIEEKVPMIADLHLQPALLPAILGFFLYSVAKVLSGSFSK